MLLKFASQIPPLFLFVNFAFFSGEVSGGKFFAWLSFYIATGPIFYYIFNGVVVSKRKVLFGVGSSEIGPYAGIRVPTLIVTVVFLGVAICWLLAVLLNHHDI